MASLRFLVLWALLLLAGCSGADLLNALTPVGATVRRGELAYGPGPRQGIDLYWPGDADEVMPLVVFFHGGGWTEGERADFRFVAAALTGLGHPVAIPDYRLYPEVRWQGFLQDGARAVGRIETLLDERGDGRRIVLAGHSAGAWIAAMLAFDGRWLAAAGAGGRDDGCGRIAAFLGLAGPYDFLPLRRQVYKDIFAPDGGPAGPETQPVTFVGPNAPPALLIAGLDDATVVPGNTRSLAAALGAAGRPVTARYPDGVGHVGLLAALGRPLRWLAPTLAIVDDELPAIAAAACRGERLDARKRP